MFIREIGKKVPEVSHKRIESPEKSVYFNHMHNRCELLLFISGEAEYNIDGQLFKPTAYDLILIPSAVYHYLIPLSRMPYENYVIGINPSIIPPEHYERLFSPPFIINIKEDSELISFFKRLDFYAEEYSGEDFDRCALALIEELVTYCSYRKGYLSSPESTGNEIIDKIIKYISQNLEKPLNADIISQKLILSKSYVQNLFSQNMHIGLKEYIMKKKIYAARADIKNGMTPIEACEKYSFGDYSGFYRLYKKTFSSSPRE
ncbi:MAG: helix-turn-helix transcriptional regulator [Clostridia bacterium]|nr:helix-turn-helix transcriptional regulator [Clostridia bacterium]